MSELSYSPAVLPSMASLPGLLQQISDRDLLLNEILAQAAALDSIQFYCWLQEDLVPKIQKLSGRR